MEHSREQGIYREDKDIIWDESGFSSGAGVSSSPIQRIDEKSRKVVLRAKSYIQERLEHYGESQWEFGAARSFGDFSNLEELIRQLRHENPNVRIIACDILAECADLYTAEQRTAVEEALQQRFSDEAVNDISGNLQCEEGEAVLRVGGSAISAYLKCNKSKISSEKREK